MKDTVNIPVEDLTMLAEALKKANEIIKGLGVRELTTPKLTPSKKRELKYKRLFEKKVKMITEITSHQSKEKALAHLKYSLCLTKTSVVHCAYFFDEIDEEHKIIVCYYK